MTATTESPLAPAVERLRELEKIDVFLTEHLFGWKWYKLTAEGRRKALAQDEIDGKPNRAHLMDGQRFLSDPSYAESQVQAGAFERVTGDELVAIGLEAHVLPISRNTGLAAVALQKCDYLSYRKHGDDHDVRCSRTLDTRGPMGIGVAKNFAEAAAQAVARAWGLA